MEAGDLSEPRLSPDQKWLSFTRTDEHRDVWLFDRARRLAAPLTRHEGEDFGSVWTPDSRRVLYISERRPFFEIYWRASDQGSPEERLSLVPGDKVPISVSPDGKILAYQELARDANIRFAALDGSAAAIAFPNVPGDQRHPVFSPDGHWLAFTSDESGRAEVYVRPFPNLASGRQQVSTEGGEEPRWTRGGREIVFRSGNRMMAAPIDPAAAPGRPVELFSGDYVQPYPVGSYSYDVAPDGNKFLMAKPQAITGGRDVVVVVNWFSELTRALAKK